MPDLDADQEHRAVEMQGAKAKEMWLLSMLGRDTIGWPTAIARTPSKVAEATDCTEKGMGATTPKLSRLWGA